MILIFWFSFAFVVLAVAVFFCWAKITDEGDE